MPSTKININGIDNKTSRMSDTVAGDTFYFWSNRSNKWKGPYLRIINNDTVRENSIRMYDDPEHNRKIYQACLVDPHEKVKIVESVINVDAKNID